MQTKELPHLFIQSPKLNQLNILKEVAADAHITQAELAKRCSLSVAMVNNYMKELCRMGLMEYHRRTIKNVTYHLTPEGEAELESLRRELFKKMVDMFANAKEHIRQRILSQSPTKLQRVVLFGCGDLAQLAFLALERTDVRILGICDDNIETIGGEFCGREVLNSSQIRFLAPDAVIIADAQRADAIYQDLKFLLNHGIGIIRLDGYDVKQLEESQKQNINQQDDENPTSFFPLFR